MTVRPVKYTIDIPGINEADFQPTRPNSKWGILTCHWPKIIGHDEVATFKKRGIPVKEVHDPQDVTLVADCTVNFIFNQATKKIYCDDDKSVIASKFAVLTPGSLLLGLAKTIYHIFFPLAIAYEIDQLREKAKEEEKKIPVGEFAKKVTLIIAKNFADIVLTPLYSVALTIVALASLLLSPINSDFLYEGRALYGELVLSWHWGQKTLIITPCMLPMSDLSDKGQKEKKRDYEMKDTFYQNQPKGTAIRGLTNLARRYIKEFKVKDENHPTYNIV